MMASTAVRLLAEVLDMPHCEGADTLIGGVELDSRKVTQGSLFLAVPGEVHDGRQFIEQAVASGAAAVAAEPPVQGFVDALAVPLVEVPELAQECGHIASRFFAEPSQQMYMVGVTGTNGKTTISRLLAQLSRLLDQPCGVIGTLGASLSEEVFQGGNTTPDAISLQRQLAQWRDQAVPAVSMEVSSHALVQGRVNGIAFDAAIFSNLSHDHLDYHGDMEAYGRAKLGLFAVESLRFAIVNMDDAFSARIASVIESDVQLLRYSIENTAADVYCSDIEFKTGSVQATLHTPWGEGQLNSPLAGVFNIGNLLAAIVAQVLAGFSLSQVLAQVPKLQSVAGRLQSIPNTLGLQVLVDYAHTPDALEKVLQALRNSVSGRLICVFGCGGDRDSGKRQVMGRIACTLADRVIVTSDNPRGESPQAILADVEAGCSGDYVLEVDRAAAIAQAIAEAEAGDCVLIAGKGHEDYQIVEGQKLYFSDEQQALEALSQVQTVQGRAPA